MEKTERVKMKFVQSIRVQNTHVSKAIGSEGWTLDSHSEGNNSSLKALPLHIFGFFKVFIGGWEER